VSEASSGPTIFETEVREQPAVLARLLAAGRPAAEAIADDIHGHRPRFAMIAARGSSDNAARYGQYLFGIRNRMVAALATPSLFTQYHAAPSLSDALVIGISQSGRSPDIVEVVSEARRQGGITLAITNEPGSPLALAAEHVLELHAGAERAVAATKTYTAQVAALAILSAALRGGNDSWEDLDRLPELVQLAIDANAHAVQVARNYSEPTRLVVLGRGLNLSTALEITLKIKETTGIMADGYSSADFLHGPKAILDRSIPVLMVAPGKVFDDLDGVIHLVKEKGAPLIAISDRKEILEQADVALPLPQGMPEWLSPIVSVVPGQIWAMGLSLARGLHPDAPAGLTKVTETR
jgi:glucosamine--fructose-6-phosphate aminotransferase (isomerizing)